MEVKGVVFNIQKFSIHDGPGVRSCTTAIIVCTVRNVYIPVPRKQLLLPKMGEFISTLIDVQVVFPAYRAAPDAR